jgi:hypothetical protein
MGRHSSLWRQVFNLPPQQDYSRSPWSDPLLQTDQGAAEALAGGGRLDLQQAADLLERHPLRVAQQQDFAVGLRQLPHDLRHAVRQLARLQALARRRSVAQQWPHQQERRPVRQGGLAPYRAPGPLDVVPVQVEQPFVGGLPRPQAERHRPALQEIVHAPHHFHLGLLHHVRRVQAGRQAWIEPHLHEGAQLVAVPDQ